MQKNKKSKKKNPVALTTQDLLPSYKTSLKANQLISRERQ